MAIKVHNGYACGICSKVYTDPMKADSCRETHDMLYIPMSRTELNRLIQAINLGDVGIVPDSLYDKFQKYMTRFGKD